MTYIHFLKAFNRGGIRSTQDLGLTMTAPGQSIGISQTLIMFRLYHFSRLGAPINFFIIHKCFFMFVQNGFLSKERGLGRSPHLRPSNATSRIKCLNTGKIKLQKINLKCCTAVCSLTAALIWQRHNTCDTLSYRQTNK